MIVEPMCQIFEKCLATGKYPSIWKKANVIPIDKKESRQSKKNYRPISIGLVSMGFNWKQISDLLSVSERTLRRWRANVDLSVSYTDMEDDELDSNLRQIVWSCPSMGERMAGGALRARGIRIQRRRLRDSMRRIDPVGRLMRKLQVMRRRVYKVEGPNALWFVNRE